MTYPFVDRRQADETRVRLVHQLHIRHSADRILSMQNALETHLEAYHSVQIPYRLDQLVYRFEKGVLEVVLDVDFPAILAFDLERWRKGFTAPKQRATESARVRSRARPPHPSCLRPHRCSLHGCAGKLLVSWTTISA